MFRLSPQLMQPPLDMGVPPVPTQPSLPMHPPVIMGSPLPMQPPLSMGSPVPMGPPVPMNALIAALGGF